MFELGWRPCTRRKHADDYRRFLEWLDVTNHQASIQALNFLTLADYVRHLRTRPKVSGVWRGDPNAAARSVRQGSPKTLSANSVNAYVRPLRSLAIWLVEEGVLASNPFRHSRRRQALNPLLPSEETPTKSATVEDLRALEQGCAGDSALDIRDQAIVSVLKTTAARNSSIRLLRIGDISFERNLIVFRRGKGQKTLEVALHAETRAVVHRYLDSSRAGLVRVGSKTELGSSPQARDDEWLFVSRRTTGGVQPLTANGISQMLTRRYHAGGGSLTYFGSHRIRHATATLLVNNGMPLDEVSRYLGHSSTMTTRRYARQTPDALGLRAAAALERSGLVHVTASEAPPTS